MFVDPIISPLLQFFIGYRSGSGTRRDAIFPLCLMVIFIENLCIHTVEFFSWQPSKKLPSKIQRLFDRAVFFRALSDILFFKLFSKSQVLLINRGKLILSDDRRQISCVSHLCIGGE